MRPGAYHRGRRLHPVKVAKVPQVERGASGPYAPALEVVEVTADDVFDAVADARDEHLIEHGEEPEMVVVSEPHAAALRHWGITEMLGIRVISKRDVVDATPDPEPSEVARQLADRLEEESS